MGLIVVQFLKGDDRVASYGISYNLEKFYTPTIQNSRRSV